MKKLGLKSLKFLLVFNLMLCSQLLLAKPLLIQITGGGAVGVPVAVADFKGSELDKDLTDIAAVVRNDLHSSGQFKVTPVTAMPAQISNAAEVEEGIWREADVEHLIIGKLEKQKDGSYNVSFQLIDLYKSSHLPALSLRFNCKDKKQLRALAHSISDKIFEKIIGLKGFFSTKLAYITVDYHYKGTTHTLTVSDADGFNDHALLTANYPLMSPAWSPDGKEIAFVSFEGNRSSVKVISVSTGKVRTITSFAGINSAPAWSPDGKRLALVLSKDGYPKLYQLELDSNRIIQLTKGAGIDTEPFWDRDSKSIVFTSNRGGKPQIYRVTLVDGEVKRLTFQGSYNATPSLTPDGKTLVMLHRTDTGYHIAVQTLATGNVKVLTKASLDESPTIAPNGTMILYGTQEDSKHLLGAVSLDGRFKMRLPAQNSNVKEPVWSPYFD